MRDIISKTKTFFLSIYLLPFCAYMVYDIYLTSKRMNIPFTHFIADSNWMERYLDENTDLGYKISMGVWIAIYTIYYLTK